MAEYHEPMEDLSQDAIEYHRIIQSVIEELEAVNWYNQRADATDDESVRNIVAHNRDEEIEHACMGLEWLRRNSEVWDEFLREFLFTEEEITELEEGEEEEEHSETGDNSLGIGDLD